MTLYDPETGRVVNGNDQTDISSSVSSGVLALTLAVGDTATIHADQASERRVALFEFTWSTTRKGKHEVSFEVVNLQKVAP